MLWNCIYNGRQLFYGRAFCMNVYFLINHNFKKMEQSNQLNENVKQLKGMLGFLNPSTSFIVNAAFAVVAFVLFILQENYGVTAISGMFKYAGGILGFLALVGLTIAAVTYPMKNNKLSANINYFIIGFMLLFNLLAIYWGIITILLVVLVLLPWAVFTFLKKDDEIRL